MWERLACRVVPWTSSPWAVLGVPLAVALWLRGGLDETRLGTVLAVAGITYAQLVLRGQAADQRREEALLRETARATPGADEHVADE